MKYLLIILFTILISCKSPNGNQVDLYGIQLQLLENRIDSLFNTYIHENEPGAAVLVVYNGDPLIRKGYGLRDLHSKAPITPGTNMRIASVSKQFTALTVLSLVDEGLIDLDDTVARYLPYEAFKSVTIRQLLNHTSGIADYDQYLDNWDTSKIAENIDILEWYKSNPKPEFNPGEKYEYSNSAYNILATLVETVSETEFNQYAREKIFKKAGMSETNYFNLAKPVDIKERAFCYEKDDIGRWKQVDGNVLNGLVGEGAIYTSLDDYYNYDVSLRQEAILSKEMHSLIFEPSSTYMYNGNKMHYSMGWNLKDSIAVHSGSWHGARTFSKHYLTVPLSVVIFMNRNDLVKQNITRKTDSLVQRFIEHVSTINYVKRSL